MGMTISITMRATTTSLSPILLNDPKMKYSVMGVVAAVVGLRVVVRWWMASTAIISLWLTCAGSRNKQRYYKKRLQELQQRQ